jgi:hypothetical protein
MSYSPSPSALSPGGSALRERRRVRLCGRSAVPSLRQVIVQVSVVRTLSVRLTLRRMVSELRPP